MRRLSYLFVFTALLLFVAAPAHAQTAPKATVSGPGEGQAVQDTVHIHGEGSADLGIRRLEISIEGTVVAETEPSSMRTNVSLDYDWNTTQQLGGGGIARNGQYTIKVTATARGGGSSTDQRTVAVDNAASQPNGLSVDAADGFVNLTWSPNPEPDITTYLIQRDDGSGMTTVAQTNETSASDQPPAGDWTYFVSAVRYSAVSQSGNQSHPAQSDGVHIDAPVPTEDPSSEEPSAGGGSTGASPSSAPGTSGKPSKNGGGKVGSVPVKAYGVKGKRLSGTIGLTGFSKLPALSGLTSLPRLPEAQDAVMAWGTYDEQLPYELQSAETNPRAAGVGVGTEQTSWILMPPDGLRWVALGMLFVAAAALLKVLAVRLRFYQPS